MFREPTPEAAPDPDSKAEPRGIRAPDIVGVERFPVAIVCPVPGLLVVFEPLRDIAERESYGTAIC